MWKADNLEAALRRLMPAPPALDRDRLMYQAGRASRAGAGRYWAIAIGLLALALAPLTIRLAFAPPKPRVERIIVKVPMAVPQPPRPAPAPAPRPETAPQYLTEDRLEHFPDVPYRQLEKSVLRWGLDGLPSSAPPPGPLPAPEPLPRIRGGF